MVAHPRDRRTLPSPALLLLVPPLVPRSFVVKAMGCTPEAINQNYNAPHRVPRWGARFLTGGPSGTGRFLFLNCFRLLHRVPCVSALSARRALTYPNSKYQIKYPNRFKMKFKHPLPPVLLLLPRCVGRCQPPRVIGHSCGEHLFLPSSPPPPPLLPLLLLLLLPSPRRVGSCQPPRVPPLPLLCH